MYSLLSRVDGLAPMRTEFERHVIVEGGSAIEKVARDASKVCQQASSGFTHPPSQDSLYLSLCSLLFVL